jgi:hypothetical protein
VRVNRELEPLSYTTTGESAPMTYLPSVNQVSRKTWCQMASKSAMFLRIPFCPEHRSSSNSIAQWLTPWRAECTFGPDSALDCLRGLKNKQVSKTIFTSFPKQLRYYTLQVNNIIKREIDV